MEPKRTTFHHLGQAALSLLLICSACDENGRGGNVPDTGSIPVDTLSSIDTLISTDQVVLAVPVDLDLAPDGSVYVLDFGLPGIVRVSPGREVETVIEGEGGGPGELSAPITLAAGADTLRVAERGNGRIQVLESDGEYIRSSSAVPGMDFGTTMRDDGWLAVPTGGLGDSLLVRVHDSEGTLVQASGELVTEIPDLINFGRIKSQIADGAIPDEIRNDAIPILDDDGGLWIVLQAEGEVRRFGPSGELLWKKSIELPEMEGIKEQFFARNREIADNPATFASLQYRPFNISSTVKLLAIGCGSCSTCQTTKRRRSWFWEATARSSTSTSCPASTPPGISRSMRSAAGYTSWKAPHF